MCVQVSPQRLKHLLGDLDFLELEIRVCIHCWLRHNEIDLPQQLDLVRNSSGPQPLSQRSAKKPKARKKARRSKSCSLLGHKGRGRTNRSSSTLLAILENDRDASVSLPPIARKQPRMRHVATF